MIATSTASTVASAAFSTTTGASVAELGGRRSPGAASPKPSLEVPTDSGTGPLPNLTALLLLVVGSLSLKH